MDSPNPYLDRKTQHCKDVIYVQVNTLNAASKSDTFLFWTWQFDFHVHIGTKHARISRKTWKGKSHGGFAFSDLQASVMK